MKTVTHDGEFLNQLGKVLITRVIEFQRLFVVYPPHPPPPIILLLEPKHFNGVLNFAKKYISRQSIRLIISLFISF